MLINLLLGVAVMALCLLLQTLLVVAVIHYYFGHQKELNTGSFWSSLTVLMGVMLLLVIGNMAQVAIWGLLFLLLGEFELFSNAFYHSAVNFATLGYGDLVMSGKYRLLGPLEAINGVLMIGVSTAVLMATIQDSIKKIAAVQRSVQD